MKTLKQLTEELNILLEYTEEPDAFETKSELEMDKAFQQKVDKDMENRELLLNQLYSYLIKRSWCHDLSLENNEIRFIVDGDATSLFAFHKWYGNSKVIKNFKVKQFNGEERSIEVYIS